MNLNCNQVKSHYFEFRQVVECRICGSKLMKKILEFPAMPVMAEPVKIDTEIPVAPLDVMVCRECGYVFLKEVIDSSIYNDYIYTPQTSSDVVSYLSGFVAKVKKNLGLPEGANGLEIGSGDGSLCKEFIREKLNFVGVEPSRVLAKISQEQNGVETHNSFMTLELADKFGKVFDIVVIRHVLEHIDDFPSFFGAINKCLREDGHLIIEVPYLGDIVAQKQFFAFFFEHLSYFSVEALKRLLGNYGYHINHSEYVNPEGGSVLICAKREMVGSVKERPDFNFQDLDKISLVFEKFQQRVLDLREKYGVLGAYGAGQRGITLINLLGLSQREVAVIFDENPVYNGLYTPVSKIPVKTPCEISKTQIEKIIILASSYDMEIRTKYHQVGRKFVSLDELV